MSGIKKALLVLTLLVIGGGVIYAAAPSFNDNFADYLIDATPDRYGRVETVFNLGIDRNLSLMDNVKRLFYPSSAAININWELIPAWGNLWTLIRSLGFIILFIMLVVTWINFIMNAKERTVPKKHLRVLFIFCMGHFLFLEWRGYYELSWISVISREADNS